MVLTVFQASIACEVKTDENPYVIFKKPVRLGEDRCEKYDH